jgi:hypothetical protein
VRSIRHTAVLSLVAAGLVLGGCGGGSSKKTSTSNPASNTVPATDPSSPDGQTVPPDNAPPASDIPKIADNNWTNGRIHVEVSGDVSSNFESDGSGATVGGATSAAFTQNTGNLVSIGLGGDEESAISLTVGDVSTVGGFSSNCSISFTKNDATGLAADFTCNDLQAVSTSATDTKVLDVKGNFTLLP